MPKGNEPWIAVKVGIRKNRKLTALPDDTARYGWLAGVLAEAKLQRPGGRFDSRGQLDEAIGRFAAHVDQYVAVGLLEVAGRLCSRCRKPWPDLPAGAYVVHDWRAHQRDPLAADRAKAWRADQNDDGTPDERATNDGPDAPGSERENDERTTNERATNDERTRDERRTNARRSPDDTADSRARGETVTVDSDKDSDRRPSPQPPGQAGGRPSRANGTSPRQVAAAANGPQANAAAARGYRHQQRRLASYRGALTDAQLREMDERDAPLDEIPGWADHLRELEASAAPTVDRL
jgi:hypothetical protein